MIRMCDLQFVKQYYEAVEQTMESALSRVEPAILQDALLHAVRGGKKVRPVLVLLSCSAAAGGSWQQALSSAAAVEFLHTSSLIHDDIMDDSSLRRGKPTLHTLHGIPFALLAGDALIALTFDTLLDAGGPNAARRLRVLNSAFRQLCQGQALDLTQTPGEDNPIERTLHSAAGKTAALFRAAAELGALHATDAPELVLPLSEFGAAVGMAFQAKDDLLDVIGLEAEMGKPAHSDRRNGRLSWLTPDSGVEAIAHAREVVHHYTSTALDALRLLPHSPARDLLQQLAYSLEERVA